MDAQKRATLPLMGETIRAAEADAAGLQEVRRVPLARAVVGDQLPDLLARTQLYYHYAPNPDARGGTRYGNAVLSPWPLLASWLLPLPSIGVPRALVGTVLSLPEGPVHFLVTHLGLQARERAQQIETILDKTSLLSGPLVLVGDFNARPEAPDMAPLFAAFDEAQTACGLNQPTFPALSARIDYIFFSREWQAAAAWVAPTDASDHYPLAADLILKKSSPRRNG